jgi:hypothetical protein
MRDLGSSITVKRLVAEQTATASITAVVTDRGSTNNNLYEGLTYAFHVGAGGITFSGTNYIALKLEESDDNSTYNVVGATGAVVLGGGNPAGTAFAQAPDSNGFVRLVNAAKASADTDPFKVSYVGNKRYCRATVVFGGTHGTGTLVGLYAVLGFPQQLPTLQ